MTARLTPLRAALVAAAVLAGMFAMHGLTHHGEHLPAVEVPVATAHADHPRAEPATVEPDGTGHADLGAMTLCLFMLLGASLAWVVTRRPGGRPLVVRRSRSRIPPAVRALTRAHAPPDLTVLSVCRC